MERPTDETLMAFADDSLESSERAAVAAYLRDDAQARGLVEMFRETRALARAAFEAPMHEQPPQALVDRILHPRAAEQAETPAASNVVSFAGETQWRRPSMQRLAVPLAASLALAVGIGGGFLIARGPAELDRPVFTLGPLAADSPTAHVLERQPSGQPNGGFLVVASFRDRLNRVCREIEYVSSASSYQPVAAAVACRQPRGQWIVEGAARIVVASQGADAGFQPSGAEEDDALTALLAMLGAKQAMSASEEKQALEGGWR